jgi:hypothetical protein
MNIQELMDHKDPWIRLMQLSKTKKAIQRLSRQRELKHADLYLINGVFNMNLHKIGAQEHDAHIKVTKSIEDFFSGHMKRRNQETGFMKRRLDEV